MFQDAPMFAVSPSYSHASSGSDDDHAVFCFCGNEVEKDEDGDVGIYCSVPCARQDALSSLTSHPAPPPAPSSASQSRTTSNASSLRLPQPLGQLPSSLSNSTLRPALDTLSLHSSNSSKTVSAGLLAPSLFSEQPLNGTSQNSSYENLSTATYENSPAEDGEGEEEVDWQASHYRRMERERLVMLEKRRRDREARKLASSNAKALADLKAQYLEQQHSQQLMGGVGSSSSQHRQQPSTSSIESYYAGGDASSSSLSRSTTSCSASSSTSSNRFISTHPSRSRTPDLLPSGGGLGQHGRNESLASTISTRSSASGSGSGWGWNSRLGWGGEIGGAPGPGGGVNGGDVIEEEEEEEEEEVERIRVPLRSGKGGKGKEREEWGAGGDGKGMRMSDVLNEILEMEKGFVVGGLGSPPRAAGAGGARDTWMGTPPRMGGAASHRGSSTPTGRKLGLGLGGMGEPRTPSRKPTLQDKTNIGSHPFPSSISKGIKRSHAQTPPSPPSNSHYNSHGRPMSRRTSFSAAHHRRTISSPSSSSKKHNHRTVLSLPFNIEEDDGHPPSQRRQRRSGSPVPPPSAVIQTRPRTLVYSPRSDVGGFGGSQRSLSASSIMDDFEANSNSWDNEGGRPGSPPLLPPSRSRGRIPTSPSNSFTGSGSSNFAFPPISTSATSRHPTSASLLVLLDHSPPLPPPTSSFPRSESMTSSQTTSIYSPTSPTLGLTTSFFHNSVETHFTRPDAPALAPPLFPCSPTPGTPEMVRMPERSGQRLRALMLASQEMEGGELDWRMGGAGEEEGEVTPTLGWGEIEMGMEVDVDVAPPVEEVKQVTEVKKGKLGWMPTWAEAEGFTEEN